MVLDPSRRTLRLLSLLSVKRGTGGGLDSDKEDTRSIAGRRASGDGTALTVRVKGTKADESSYSMDERTGIKVESSFALGRCKSRVES